MYSLWDAVVADRLIEAVERGTLTAALKRASKRLASARQAFEDAGMKQTSSAIRAVMKGLSNDMLNPTETSREKLQVVTALVFSFDNVISSVNDTLEEMEDSGTELKGKSVKDVIDVQKLRHSVFGKFGPTPAGKRLIAMAAKQLESEEQGVSEGVFDGLQRLKDFLRGIFTPGSLLKSVDKHFPGVQFVNALTNDISSLSIENVRKLSTTGLDKATTTAIPVVPVPNEVSPPVPDTVSTDSPAAPADRPSEDSTAAPAASSSSSDKKSTDIASDQDVDKTPSVSSDNSPKPEKRRKTKKRKTKGSEGKKLKTISLSKELGLSAEESSSVRDHLAGDVIKFEDIKALVGDTKARTIMNVIEPAENEFRNAVKSVVTESDDEFMIRWRELAGISS